jgi:hypothetical protein
MGRLNWNQRRGGESGEPAEESEGWEVPAATDSGADPWLGPGSLRAAEGRPEANADAPFQCVACGASMQIEGAFASGGDLYCFEHRPHGAVSGLSLPKGIPTRSSASRPGGRGRLQAVMRWLWDALISDVRR